MSELDDADWYFENVLYYAEPGGRAAVPADAERWQAWWRAQARWLGAEFLTLAGTAMRQGFALTTEQLTDLGITRARTRGLLAGGTWRSSQRGTVSVIDPAAGEPTDRWSRERRACALATTASVLVNRGHVAGHRSAAILHGLPTMRVPERPELTVTPRRTTHRSGTREATLRPVDLARWWGAPVTSVGRTVLDLMRTDRHDGLMAADAALHDRLVTASELRAALDRARCWPGTRQARELLPLACPKAESPLESLTRLALHDDGFPPPEPQFEIAVPGRRYPYRVDLCWPDRRLVLEADGRGKYDDAALGRERKREARLRRLGYRIERVMWSDVVDTWPATRELLWDALR